MDFKKARHYPKPVTDMAPLRVSRDEFEDLSVCYGYAMNFNAAGEGRGI